MRIKKKDIKENLDAKINNRVNKIKAVINQTAGDFEQMGIDGSEDLAADVVSSALDSSEDMNEDSVSDSQRRFFNAVHKCKVDGDCPSSEIKKAAEGMSLSDIEDFAFTKGELPDSIDEVASDYQNGNNTVILKQKIEKAKSELLKQNFASTAVINISRTEEKSGIVDKNQLHKHKNVRLNLCKHGFPTLVELLPNYFDEQGVKPITEYYKGEKLQAYVPSKLYDFVSDVGVLSNDTAIEKLSSKLDELLISESNSPLKEDFNRYEEYQELSDRVNNAKINGNNVAFVKADRNKMYYHILDVIIDDDGIQFKGGISRSKDEITNPLLGSYNVTPENAHKMGPYALNIFNKVLDAAESNRILDVSDMKNPKMVDNGNIEEVNGDHFGDDEKLDIEVGADDYEEYQELLKNIGNHGKSIDLDSVEDGLPFESVRPKMTKSELTEAVKNICENNKTPRKVVKTFKVKNLRNGKK
tara:strand:- start:9614 stop:11026 length:1413 start_codon:yes stop_codon:yes gene_type:complete